MNEGSIITLMSGALIAFSVSFLCSLMEASLLSLSPGELATLEKHKSKIGDIVRGFKEQIELPVTVILILNTVAHTVGAIIVGAETALLFGEKYIGISSGVFTYMMLQFTEILPKSLGVHYNIRIVELSAIPLRFLIVVLKPVITLLRFLNKPFEKKKSNNHTATLDEINALAGYAQLSKQISTNQANIIKGVTLLSMKKAEDLMIPVDQITFLSKSQTLSEAIIKAHLDPHTRFPVIECDNINRVIGYVNFKELVYRMRTNPADPTLGGIIRPLRFVNEDTSCQQLLKVFVDEHEHMALVQDADKTTLGLITLEDIVEELVGEIEDEFDKLPKNIHMLSQGVWIVGGGASMKYISEKLDSPDLSCDSNISNWIIKQIGHIPAVDERIKAEGHEFNVRRIRRGKVFEVLITPESISAPRK
ncbi:MAG: HlyC/CorC family transporter [Sedimentisphaerales bacterium]|nr:HlyC/CorC family transporter [Sedimentisphaerales bacterium]